MEMKIPAGLVKIAATRRRAQRRDAGRSPPDFHPGGRDVRDRLAGGQAGDTAGGPHEWAAMIHHVHVVDALAAAARDQ